MGIWLSLAGVCLGTTACRAPERDRPNVVLLIVDTLRADKLGCYGHLLDPSPEIDALAERGVLFEHVVAPCSWTRPSTGSILTGRYPRSLGIFKEQNGILPDPSVTLAEALHQSGYTTVGITANPHLNRSFNFHQGFDHYFDSDVVYSFMEKGSGQSRFKTSRVASAREMFDVVLDVIGKDPQGPHYVQVNVMDVHEWSRGGRALTRQEFKREFLGNPDRAYLQAIRQTSHDIDEFIARLRSLPGWADALFVITSDHGEGLKDHPRVANSVYHGLLLYESQLRVPLVLHRAGWKHAGTRVARPVRLLDVMPTVLDLAGVPVPEGLDGVSLLPLIRDAGAEVPLPEYFVAETELRTADKAAVYSRGWKYIESYKSHAGVAARELQIMGRSEDGMRTNRIDDFGDIAQEMASYLEAWKRRYSKVPSTFLPAPISPEETEQLRALGYID